MDSDEDTLEETVEGLLDDDGLPHGFCTVTYSSTDRFEGNFVHGEKNGRGKFFFFDGSTLEGYYVDDALQGQGLYTYEDGGVLHGTHVDGELNGPAQEYDIDGRLIFKGQYKDNIRHGVCWIYYPVSLISCFLCWRTKEGHRSHIGCNLLLLCGLGRKLLSSCCKTFC
uniref:Histone-lysine N-methyltransferase SETD7 n=1 Tax=Chrysemys picta bellii TaxID=8478 RepID=A0A8C3IZ22_CHRPI